MKTLISIGSWENAAYLGYNQSQRDTWIKDTLKVAGLDYRFFFGDNNPTGEDESSLANYDSTCKAAHGTRYDYIKVPVPFVPQKDEVVLQNLPDDHKHNTFKTQKALRWAIEKGYDHIYVCGVDTLVHVDRLLSSGFEKHHYSGTDQWSPYFAGGGPGYWLSAEAAAQLTSIPVGAHGHCEYVWAEDNWVGGMMEKVGIALHPDRRYKEWPVIPLASNDFISSHLGVPTPEEPIYRAQRMYNTFKEMTA